MRNHRNKELKRTQNFHSQYGQLFSLYIHEIISCTDILHYLLDKDMEQGTICPS